MRTQKRGQAWKLDRVIAEFVCSSKDDFAA
jgi:hypothetical protein